MRNKLLIASLLTVLSGCDKASDEPAIQSQQQQVTIEPASPPQISLIKKIFNTEMLGANLPYLENVTGPARNTFSYKENEQTNTYRVDDCDITVNVSNGVVQSLEIEHLSPECTFDLNPFFPNLGNGKLPMPHKMTFGQFDAFTDSGNYTADCLIGCGNAADPAVYENWEGSRADGNIELQLGVVLVADSAIEASNNWENAMVKTEGEDWVIDTKFNCTHKYNSIAKQAFKNVNITSIKIGFGLTETNCNL
ncbi:hypothetical protein NMD15_04590 [Plesiomonas shigelloides]|uniref:hypothetical protein n=1 Tax=Plesiomonas shigelloides TaxID=703 RepID=UPI00351D34E4